MYGSAIGWNGFSGKGKRGEYLLSAFLASLACGFQGKAAGVAPGVSWGTGGWRIGSRDSLEKVRQREQGEEGEMRTYT